MRELKGTIMDQPQEMAFVKTVHCLEVFQAVQTDCRTSGWYWGMCAVRQRLGLRPMLFYAEISSAPESDRHRLNSPRRAKRFSRPIRTLGKCFWPTRIV